ncbi:MAG TPA: aminopeptidase P family protein [Gaiellaceae bacterium]|nr:aminopeptidase P family protein [Gaiellaceae bacterium]
MRERLEEPLLITNLVNIRYLCGFDSSNAALLVEHDRVRLFTDFRYIHSAHETEGVEVVETRRALVDHVAELLSGQIGFETVLPFAQYQTLESSGLDLVPRSGVVEALRAVKDEHELDTIRRICAITDRVYERLLDVPFVGRRELDVAWDLAGLFHEEGATAIAFELIVGSGPTGSHPHGRAGERKIEAGELVVIDAGCTIDGYSSDYTRTFATGPVDGEAKEAYAVVLSAQEAALGAIRAGIPAIEVDAAARRVIDDSPFAGKFGHGLGHGLGLDVHEAPRMSPESEDVLAAGNVVTVEPGVYVEGRFGIRIEDDVVVTAGGLENLTGFRKDLLEVG